MAFLPQDLSQHSIRRAFQGIEVEELELGRDPNLVKCTDNYEDAVDCRGTRKLLAKFRKMEMQAEDMEGNTGKNNELSCFPQNKSLRALKRKGIILRVWIIFISYFS